ncbi:MAG: hypothetical protein NUW37_01760 [Planctomycetes bacterium]|nr:hypothetical protein [Planctomycetota bacterium]
MSTVKKDVAKLLDKLPEDVTYDDIHYNLYVLEKIKKGLKDVEEENLLTTSQVRDRLEKWLK